MMQCEPIPSSNIQSAPRDEVFVWTLNLLRLFPKIGRRSRTGYNDASRNIRLIFIMIAYVPHRQEEMPKK